MSVATPTAPYYDARRIGDATSTVVNDGDVAVPVAAVFADEDVAWLGASGEADDQATRVPPDQSAPLCLLTYPERSVLRWEPKLSDLA